MTGNEYLRAVRRPQAVVLRHDLVNGNDEVLAPAGGEFSVELKPTEFGDYQLVARGLDSARPWRCVLAPGDLHDAATRVARCVGPRDA